MVSALALLAGCASTDSAGTGPSSSASTTARAVALEADVCREVPAEGRIDRAGHGLEFRSGSLQVAVERPGPGDANRSACYGFTKSGNADPSVPPDSLLFVFTGPGVDGAQIEFSVGDLTGGVLPPIGGVRPRVGPLDGPITSAVGVSVDGTYLHSTTCPLTFTAVSSDRVAGTFTCAAVMRSASNPFAPGEDADDDSSSADVTVTESDVTLSGWFETTP
ncbi:MAG: hypothetical protein SW127_14230 [Actinomycetota bacterium]|nr:hypothetical protein [Actinomycetota bacterium]